MSAQPTHRNQMMATKANAAFSLITQDIIERANRFHTMIAVWRDGRVVKLTPEEVEAEISAQNPNRSGTQ